ncbi:carboxylesterase family protein [Testudinibacter sp. P80/BLE/0925]|uniref:carboxylesterase family protein n=1 Tax=Testudinibacter sp. TW-1 TaxID=3417757 RepID=UPI003D36A665
MKSNNPPDFYCECLPIAKVDILGERITQFKLRFSSPISGMPLFNTNSIAIFLASENTDNQWEKLSIAYIEQRNASAITVFIKQALNDSITKTLKFDQVQFRQQRCHIQVKIKFKFQVKDIFHRVLKVMNLLPIQHIEIDKCQHSSFNDLDYNLYVPHKNNTNHPLIIYLHGAGEGGDNQSHLIADRAVATFTDPAIQQFFDYPFILAPQCPDFWLKEFKLNGITYFGKQDYTATLIYLIKNIFLQHPQIDKKRVYIIGASMGGYQGLRLLAHSPDLFSAGIIACPAEIPSNELLDNLNNIPMWLLHSRKDEVVPVKNTEYIINYLTPKNPNLKYQFFSDIIIQNLNLDPHCVFLYLYENIPNINGISIFQWLKQQIGKPNTRSIL